MADTNNCPCTAECPLQKALGVLGGKWKAPIICALLADGPLRYNEILKRTKGISNTMLSQTLKEMETDHLIRRNEYLEVPVRVEYSAAEKAKKLLPILSQLAEWYVSAE